MSCGLLNPLSVVATTKLKFTSQPSSFTHTEFCWYSLADQETLALCLRCYFSHWGLGMCNWNSVFVSRRNLQWMSATFLENKLYEVLQSGNQWEGHVVLAISSEVIGEKKTDLEVLLIKCYSQLSQFSLVIHWCHKFLSLFCHCLQGLFPGRIINSSAFIPTGSMCILLDMRTGKMERGRGGRWVD